MPRGIPAQKRRDQRSAPGCAADLSASRTRPRVDPTLTDVPEEEPSATRGRCRDRMSDRRVQAGHSRSSGALRYWRRERRRLATPRGCRLRGGIPYWARPHRAWPARRRPVCDRGRYRRGRGAPGGPRVRVRFGHGRAGSTVSGRNSSRARAGDKRSSGPRGRPPRVRAPLCG